MTEVNYPSLAQDEWEFGCLLDEMDKLTIESILEIGVWHGGSLARFGHRFPYCIIVGIDPAPQIERWDPKWGAVSFVYGDSQDESIRGQALTLNKHRKFDVIHIDGDHHLDAVKKDWVWAAANATQLIAIHDIVDSNNPDLQVHILWEGIRDSPMFKTKEIIRGDSRNYGYGLVYLNPEVN